MFLDQDPERCEVSASASERAAELTIPIEFGFAASMNVLAEWGTISITALEKERKELVLMPKIPSFFVIKVNNFLP